MGIKIYVLKKESISAPESPFFFLGYIFFSIKSSDSQRTQNSELEKNIFHEILPSSYSMGAPTMENGVQRVVRTI